MRKRHVIALAVAFLILSGYYGLFEVSNSPDDPKAKKGKPVFLLDPWDVKALRVVTQDGRQFSCERDGDRWHLVAGKQNDGYEGTIEDFIASLLATVEIDQFPQSDQDLANFGLVNPRMSITVTDVTGKAYQLTLGDSTPAGTCLYARFTDTPKILIVGALLDWEVKKLNPLLS